MTTLQTQDSLQRKGLWNAEYVQSALAKIEEAVFKKQKKRAWEHLCFLEYDLDSMIGYNHKNCMQMMWDLLLDIREDWLQGEKVGGDKTGNSAAKGTSSDIMEGEGTNKIFVPLIRY